MNRRHLFKLGAATIVGVPLAALLPTPPVEARPLVPPETGSTEVVRLLAREYERSLLPRPSVVTPEVQALLDEYRTFIHMEDLLSRDTISIPYFANISTS